MKTASTVYAFLLLLAVGGVSYSVSTSNPAGCVGHGLIAVAAATVAGLYRIAAVLDEWRESERRSWLTRRN